MIKRLIAGIVLALLSFVMPAQAQTALFGVMCYSERAAEASALAYDEGGIDLQDEVLDHLINVTMDCVRIPEAEALIGYFVYEGKIIGVHMIVGVAPEPHGQPLLFGIISAPLAPKTGT